MKVGLAGLAVVGAGGWIGLRLYMRQRFIEEFEKSQVAIDFANAQQMAAIGGIDLHLPTAEELSVSAVPLFGTNHPEEAVNDIFVNGRESPYWPEEYRDGPDLSAFGLSSGATGELETLARALLRRRSQE